MGSYNYLGFGECDGPCNDAAQQAIESFGVASCSSSLETGKSHSIILQNTVWNLF